VKRRNILPVLSGFLVVGFGTRISKPDNLIFNYQTFMEIKKVSKSLDEWEVVKKFSFMNRTFEFSYGCCALVARSVSTRVAFQ